MTATHHASTPLRAVLLESFGDRFDVELLTGFVIGLGAALLRNPDVIEETVGTGVTLIAEFDELPPAFIPVQPATVQTSLDDALSDALVTTADRFRAELGRLPRLTELLDIVAASARGHLADFDGNPLTLRSLRPVDDERNAEPAFTWNAVRALLVFGAGEAESEQLVDYALHDHDWRARMTAVLAVGRLRLPALANRARTAEVPALGNGVTDDDRRTLLALREVAAARAEGRALDRPRHPDAEVESGRAALLADVEAAVEGTRLPGPDSPAGVLRTLLNPE